MLHLRAKDNPFDRIVELIAQLEHPAAGDQDDIADEVRAGFAENFANESSGGGQAWAQLAESTVKQRGSAHPILVRTGLGKASFIQKGATDHIQRMLTSGAGWTIEVGSENDIMMIHQAGSPKTNMPARPMGELSERAEERVARRIDTIIERLERQILGN